jgi:hypothetical protein
MKQLCLSFSMVVVLPLLVAACGDDDGGDDTGTPDASLIDAGPPDASVACMEATQHQDFTWIQTNVFNRSCVASSCHDSMGAPAAQLILEAGAAHAQIVGVDSVELPSMKRIAAGEACENSFLYQKITNGPAVAQGNCDQTATDKMCDPMPTVGGTFQPLCQEKIDAICRWIAAGAPND